MSPVAIVLARMSAGPLRDAYLDTATRGWTPLMQHVRDGDEAAVVRALEGGGDIDAIAEGAVTALSLACDAGSEAIVARLLAAGVDPRTRARHDLTVLHLAAAHSPLEVTRRLVEAGAPIERAGGMTPLTVAIECDRIDVLAYLVTQEVRWPSEAFAAASEHGRLLAMQLLWDRFGAEVWPQGSPTALMHAARGGSAEAVHFLVDHGARVDEFDLKDDLSPLMLAVTHGRHDAARALLERGANPDCQTEWFVTAMRIAERNADRPMLELLRAHGARPSENHEHVHVEMPYATYSSAVARGPRTSPLDYALATDDVAALARLEPKDPTGALCAAASAGAPDCVAFLLACGADPHAGRPSALACAIRACDARAVRMMLAAPAAALEPAIVHAAVSQSDPWILRDVLDHGGSVDARLYSRRPTDSAALEGRWAHLALLLGRGAAFDEDLNGDSPLSLAARFGYLRCVDVLIDHELASGGLQTIKTAGAYRPGLEGIRRIDMALFGAEGPRVIELLVRRGADVALVDRLRR